MSPGSGGGDGEAPAARIVRLRHRREFLAAARGQRAARDAFVLQAVDRPQPGAAAEAGIGFTVTKKIGNAVRRNRARRRLREALRLILPDAARAGRDYVVVARAAALTQPFARLQQELAGALAQLGRRRGRVAS